LVNVGVELGGWEVEALVAEGIAVEVEGRCVLVGEGVVVASSASVASGDGGS
jgi:hypothetical protein